jgi:low temperature requirement protein LtrA
MAGEGTGWGMMVGMPRISLLRASAGARPVTNVEVFFDLVYAFAVTQLSHYLLDHATVEGVIQTTILFGMVWIVWASTAYLADWLDPNRLPVRRMLLAIMFISLLTSAAIPQAFEAAGLAFGAAYATVQVGRSIFAMYAMRHERLERNFQRFFVWSLLGGSLAIAGGLAQGHVRELVWALVFGIDLFSAGVGFYVPGLGRTATLEWNVDAGHVAERIQAFVMIALGESIIIIGASLAGFRDLSLGQLVGYFLAFVTTVSLWWVYFDRSAAYAARALAASSDPGRLARSAFYWAQVPMVGGIIAVAAGDRLVLANPTGAAGVATASILLGGTALFIGGHLLFKLAIWHHVSRSHLAAIVLLLLMTPIAAFLPGLVVAALAVVGLVVVVAAMRGRPAADVEAMAAASGAAHVGT